MSTALITGISGQDGKLLARLLESRGQKVVGIGRGQGTDITDWASVEDLIKSARPDFIYHLAACHHDSQAGKALSIELDQQMVRTNFLSTQYLAQAVLKHRPACRIFYAGSSQMFTPAKVDDLVNENTPFSPSTFYGRTKVWSQQLLAHYRERHGLWACTGILFNHESIHRPDHFVTRYLTKSAAQIKKGLIKEISVQNPFAVTDWSAAEDFVEAFTLITSADRPKDYILATGRGCSVGDVIQTAFSHLGMEWKAHVSHPSEARRPPCNILGDSSALRTELGWSPKKDIHTVVREMVDHDLALTSP